MNEGRVAKTELRGMWGNLILLSGRLRTTEGNEQFKEPSRQMRDEVKDDDSYNLESGYSTRSRRLVYIVYGDVQKRKQCHQSEAEERQ